MKKFVLISQINRSAVSVPSNIAEGTSRVSSKEKEFIAKMSISSKEARETRYWLRLIDKSDLVNIDVSEELKEIEHLINILTSIVKTSQQNLQVFKT